MQMQIRKRRQRLHKAHKRAARACVVPGDGPRGGEGDHGRPAKRERCKTGGEAEGRFRGRMHAGCECAEMRAGGEEG